MVESETGAESAEIQKGKRLHSREARDCVSRRDNSQTGCRDERRETIEPAQIQIYDFHVTLHRLWPTPDFLYNDSRQNDRIHSPSSPSMFFMASTSSSASSSPSSTSSSPIHHASLVDPASHHPALLELIDVKVSKQVIGKSTTAFINEKKNLQANSEYTVDRVVETVDYAMGRPTPSSSRGRSSTRRPEHAKFTTFVNTVLTRAEVTMPTLLASFVYIDRARPHLHIGLEQWALERVFLGALIVASKVCIFFFSSPS